jgi:hypothetical protein
VYVGAGSRVYAIDATTGAQIWTYTTGGQRSSPIFANGVVYVGSGSLVYAVNASTGTQIWNATTQGIVSDSSPAVGGGAVYVSSTDTIYCFDSSIGTQIWNYTAGGQTSSPVFADGYVYFGSDDGNVYCLVASTGDKIWNYKIDESALAPGLGREIRYGPILSYSPTVANGVVYISLSAIVSTAGGTSVGIIYALKTETAATPSPSLSTTPYGSPSFTALPSPSTSLSDLQLTAVLVVMGVIILATLLVYMARKKRPKGLPRTPQNS